MRKKSIRATNEMLLLEALEPRNLLTAFVVFDGSLAVLGTIPGKNVSLSTESAALGPAIQATINWGDGSSSAATLARLPNGRLQVVGGHAYDTTKKFHVTVTTDAGDITKTALKTTANVRLNAARGRTINMVAGQAFSGVVGTLQRLKPLPRITTPEDALFLPQGTAFGQFTAPTGDARATFRVDWGDGTVTDATIVSNSHGNYNVLASHTYAAAGAYRVVTNVIIETPQGSLLHIDQVDSTAHVKSAPGNHSTFSLPSHVALDLSQILPPLDLSNSGGDTGTSGGSGGSIDLNGGGSGTIIVGNGGSGGDSGSSGGILNLGGGGGNNTFSGPIISTGGGSIILNLGSGSGSGILTLIGNSTLSGSTGTGGGDGSIITGGTLILGGGAGGLISGATSSGSGSIVLTGTSSIPTLLLTANFDSTQSFNNTSNTSPQLILNLTGNPITDLSIARLLGQTSWTFNADGSLSIASTNAVVKITNAIDILAHLTGGTITFDSGVTSSQIIAAAGALPSGFVGTVTLPVYLGDLVVWPTGATVTEPPAPPPTETPIDPSPDSTT